MCHQVMVLKKKVTAASRGLLLRSRAPLWRQRTPKDGVSLVTALTNAIYMYWVWVKGIDIVLSPDDKEVCVPYAVGDPIRMKPPGS